MARRRPVDGQDKCQGGYGHCWFDAEFEYDLPPWAKAWLKMACDRCEKRCIDLFDANGNRWRRYVNPAGWRKHNKVKRIEVAKAVKAGRTVDVHNVVPVPGFERRRGRA